MNDKSTQPALPEDALLERLFEGADPRPVPPPDEVREVRAALAETWRQAVRTRRMRQRRVVALAASAVLAVVAALLWQRPFATPLTVASVEVVRGDVRHGDGGAPQALRSGLDIHGGARVQTGEDAAAALRWRTGDSLRVGEHTTLEIGRDGTLTLVAGRVYIDSHGGRALTTAPPLVVHTRLGAVSHIGTRYLAAIDDERLQVSVREGLVQVLDAQLELRVEAGQRLSRHVDGRTERAPHPAYGEAWRWAEDIAPRENFDGRPIAQFLGWLARETGRTVRYASPAARALADDERLRGQVDPAPSVALAILHATTDLRAQIRNGEIIVDLARDAQRP